MEQPECGVEPTTVRLVARRAYCLKKTPRVWYRTLCEFLSSLNFKRLINDKCVLIGIIEGTTCYSAVYVDELLIITPSFNAFHNIKEAPKKRSQMSNLGEAKYLLR